MLEVNANAAKKPSKKSCRAGHLFRHAKIRNEHRVVRLADIAGMEVDHD